MSKKESTTMRSSGGKSTLSSKINNIPLTEGDMSWWKSRPSREQADSMDGESFEEAVKFDTEKPRTDLLPAIPLMKIAEVFGHGASKYGDLNYKKGKGLDPDRLYGAAMRHLFAWKSGEELDPDSGLHHLDHAATSLLMIREIELS